MEKKNTLLLTVIAVATLLVAVVGATFAYFGSFAPDNSNNTAVNVNLPTGSSSTFVSNGAQLLLNVPADNMTFAQRGQDGVTTISNGSLNVSLTSGTEGQTMECTYDVYFETEDADTVYGIGTYTKNGDKEITMTIASNDAQGLVVSKFATEANFDADINNGWALDTGKYRVKVASGTISNNKKDAATTQTLTFTGKVYNLDVEQKSIEGKTFKGYFYADLKADNCRVKTS